MERNRNLFNAKLNKKKLRTTILLKNVEKFASHKECLFLVNAFLF